VFAAVAPYARMSTTAVRDRCRPISDRYDLDMEGYRIFPYGKGTDAQRRAR